MSNVMVHHLLGHADRLLRAIQVRVRRCVQNNMDANRVVKPTGKPLTLGRAYEAEWKTYPCVFVLSTGRTGTQSLASVLNLSPHIHAVHEPLPRLVKASYEAFQDMPGEHWIAKWGPLVLASRDDLVLQAASRGRIYVESNNRLTYLAPALQSVFPASKFIYSHRHPYEVIRSGMQRGAYQGAGKAWNFARIHPRSGEDLAAAWEHLDAVEKEAWRWARINIESKRFFDSLPVDKRFELPARSFFNADEDFWNALFEFVGAPVATIANIKDVMRRRMNAQSHFNGMTFEWTPELRQKVRPYIEDIAGILGYEL